MISRPSSHPTAHRLQRAYAYRCAMCGFDGRLGRNPVAIEGAHVRWHSQDGPDDLANAIAFHMSGVTAAGNFDNSPVGQFKVLTAR